MFSLLKKFVDHNLLTGESESLLDQNLLDHVACFSDIGTDQNALAQRQSIRLHRAMSIDRGSKLSGLLRTFKNSGPCCGNAIFLHKLLREDFGTLELRSLLVRSTNAESLLLEEVHDAKGQRVVGTDDRKVK